MATFFSKGLEKLNGSESDAKSRYVVTIMIRLRNIRRQGHKTSNNQRLGSAFDDLDPRLSLLCQVGDVIRPCKICGGCQIRVPRSFHSLIDCPIQSRLQSVLGVLSFYVERNNYAFFYLRVFILAVQSCTKYIIDRSVKINTLKN